MFPTGPHPPKLKLEKGKITTKTGKNKIIWYQSSMQIVTPASSKQCHIKKEKPSCNSNGPPECTVATMAINLE